MSAQPTKMPAAEETPEQWRDRVLAEHGPPPQQLRDFYAGLVARVRSREAAKQAGAS